MKIANILLAFLLVSSVAFSAQTEFTGKDYLSLSKRERVETVLQLKEDAKQAGVVIRKAPVHYCKMLDTFYQVHPELKKESLTAVLKTLIIMEYDWEEKGVNKDTLARQWLGDKSYNSNKDRLKTAVR